MNDNDPQPGAGPPDEPDLAREEPIFGAILWVLVLSVVAGVALALVGDLVLGSDSVRNTGTGIGVVSGLIYFVFRRLGKREAARRRARSREADEP